MLEAVINSKDKTEMEKHFKQLERVGMDRQTAIVLCKELIKEKKNKEFLKQNGFEASSKGQIERDYIV